MIYRVDRYDIRGRELLSTGFKYYTADLGLRNYLLGRDAVKDIGQLVENAVYLELLRRRYAVKVGKYNNLEVDFVASNSNNTECFQISTDVSRENTMERELAPLQSIKDNYPKYLLSLSELVARDADGIVIGNLIDWLLED